MKGIFFTSSILYQATIKCNDSKHKQARRYTWESKGLHNAYNPNLRKCNLCLNKKLPIIDNPDRKLLEVRHNMSMSLSKQVEAGKAHIT